MTDPAGPVEMRLMNEHGVDEGLWTDDGLVDVDELGLNETLRAHLRAFGERWNDAVVPEVWDDRWDGVPVMMTLVSWKYRLLALRPGVRSAAVAEDVAMRRIGEDLATEVQRELGSAYRVAYQH